MMHSQAGASAVCCWGCRDNGRRYNGTQSDERQDDEGQDEGVMGDKTRG